MAAMDEKNNENLDVSPCFETVNAFTKFCSCTQNQTLGFEFLKRIYCKESVEQTILQLLMIFACLLTQLCNVFCKYRAVVSSCDFALFKGCEVLAKGFYLSCNSM